MPCVLMRPTVVLSPTSPQKAAGRRTDPPVSVPIPAAARAAAVATAEPLLEPPGTRWVPRSHGFQGVPQCSLVPQPPKASSTVCVLPMTIAPAAMRRRTTVAVTAETRLRQAFDPAVVTRPCMSMMSFTAMGMPCSGPRS